MRENNKRNGLKFFNKKRKSKLHHLLLPSIEHDDGRDRNAKFSFIFFFIFVWSLGEFNSYIFSHFNIPANFMSFQFPFLLAIRIPECQVTAEKSDEANDAASSANVSTMKKNLDLFSLLICVDARITPTHTHDSNFYTNKFNKKIGYTLLLLSS